MNLILNILWLLFGGLTVAVQWVVAGVFCIIFIITIPFAKGCFEVAGSSLMPFGKKVYLKKNFGEPTRPIMSFFWIILVGFWLAILQIFTGICQCLTIIGIPFGIQTFKLVKVTFNPYKYTLR